MCFGALFTGLCKLHNDSTALGRVLRLTLLAPNTIDAILAGRQLATLKLDDLLKQIPVQWEKQLETIAKG
jgi:hypothetical protein